MKKLFSNTLRGFIRTTGILALTISFITFGWIAVVTKLIVKGLSKVEYHSSRVSSILCHEVKGQMNSFKKFNL